ncbi:aminodeoxychorismate synthase component I [Streptomyces virginiae]|uniref:aminodeoxychorismate synthase component I n=1 Tax=Streptomyces virginiae TaxID=1961 RepID=UPI0022587814|nr:aminodeoxychorismate synthase component I [Streptomyces virginiae]MCX4957994.1 aminodeoxychorismate synthase component I [Streptomyces virginiae]
MRTLLIDNYDSFTYNLFHQITEAGGREPEVVRNDDPRWNARQLADFDNVVVSPGPGTPLQARDLGISREILATTRLPALGICLGHQAIGALHGATVGRAPAPLHGRISRVRHDGKGLFAGLPSPMEVVRYHSLAVTDLPPELEATAWTADGILMGLRHRTRPMWGVQFHPESICAEYGVELLRNFMDLSALAARPPRRIAETRPRAGSEVRSEVRSAVAAAPAQASSAGTRRLRVLTHELPTGWDPERAYDLLFRGNPYSFWLDSSRPDATGGRFSIMGDASGPLARVARADVWSGTVRVDSAADTEIVSGPFLDWLDQDLRAIDTDVPALPFDFALGWTGYLGYELKSECGGELVHRSEDPDAVMVFTDRALVLDHHTGTTHLLALADDGVEGSEATARRRLAELADRLAHLPPGAAPAPDGSVPMTGEIRLRHDRASYLGLIAAAHEEIAAGETYEVCLTNTAEVRGRLDPWAGYLHLRRTHPAPFGALLRFGGLSVLSTSPERFLRIDRDGLVESRPIKGTRPRGATPAEDAALVADLLTCEKDRAENLMIVDLVRNDLGRCAEPGSVEATDIFRVESFAGAHQLVSTVRARLRRDSSAVQCVRAAFPGGSMTGAPKVRTMRIIDRLEAGPRGVYSGALGYFSLSGAADLSIVIRTALVTEDKVRYGTGGAIIALSDAAAEFEETAVKAGPLLSLTTAPFPGRSAVRDGRMEDVRT